MKVLVMLNFRVVTAACLAMLSWQSVQAQSSGPSAADVQRSIEQNRPDLNRTAPKPAAKLPAAPVTYDQGFARLKEVKVQSALFQQELADYWKDAINKPVSAQKLTDFKAKAWELFQSKGYLAYISTSAQATPEGSVLTVLVSMPVVGKVTVLPVDAETVSREYVNEVARRFKEIYPTGTPVDVHGFEAQLNAAAYDLPVDLEISLRQVDSKVVDVTIHLRRSEAQVGKVLGGFVQGNNYGLQQFGRTQVLGNVRVQGFTPSSELALTTQISQGVGYYRAEYEAPVIGTGMHWRTYGSQVHSYAKGVQGLSEEVGLGLNKLLQTDRSGRWISGIELSKRQAQNWTSGVATANRIDHQFRVKLRADSSRDWVDNFYNEFTLISGNINLDRNNPDMVDDSNNRRVAGNYQKLEANGGLSQVLDKDRYVTGSMRWRAQTASKNLDTYNKISMGGVNSIRALTSLDGVGDQGAQLSFDIIHQAIPTAWGGLFYDIGVVKSNKFEANNPGYVTLEGAGWQVGGKEGVVTWSLSVGKFFGKTTNSWTPTNTQNGDWRGNFAVTHAF
jgi:hemolysin activation/secretion protein